MSQDGHADHNDHKKEDVEEIHVTVRPEAAAAERTVTPLHALLLQPSSMVERVRFLLCFAMSVVATRVIAWWLVESRTAPTLPSLGQKTMGSTCILALLYNLSIVVYPHRHLNETSERIIASAAELAIYLLLFYVVDRLQILGVCKKTYSPDVFWFVVLAFFLAGACTLKRIPPPAGAAETTGEARAADGADECYHVPHLNRHQTEEWKGWMQMLFLWYHYFDNKQIYNAIRLFIAAYVWMTGFGNFSYYYVREDFSLSRFCQMQWRLNFFVLCVCLIMQNEYMLYYICPLHTLFTLCIYAGLGIKKHLHRTNRGMMFKCGVLFAASFVMWDIKAGQLSWRLFQAVWWPLRPLVGYHDPYTPTRHVLQEWFFRSGLDHLIWIVGMLCAYAHPAVEAWLQRLDARPSQAARVLTQTGIVGVSLALLVVYYRAVYRKEKKAYVALHPYTSFVPLLLYLVLRNVSRVARMYYVGLFEALGKITLETYITQFHIWMLTTGVNGSPKLLLCLLPADYPLCNFAITSVIMTLVSHRAFVTSNEVKLLFLSPKATNAVLLQNVLTGAAVLLVTAALLVPFTNAA